MIDSLIQPLYQASYLIVSLAWRRLLLLPALLFLVSTYVLAQDAPKNPRGVEIAQSEVKWEWDSVGDVRHYEITVDGQIADFTRDLQYFSRNLWAGDHSMTVIAIKHDGQRSDRSTTAKIVVNVSFDPSNPARGFLAGGAAEGGAPTPAALIQNDQAGGSISIPTSPRGQEVGQASVRWEWNGVAGASQYEVTIDGNVAGNTPNTSFFSENLWSGDHSMTVRAISGSGQYSGASQTAKIIVSSAYNSANPASSFLAGSASSQPSIAAPPPPTIAASALAPAPPPPQNDNGLVDVASWSMPDSNMPGYDLVFSDEFNSNSLNSNRWRTQLRWDGEFNGERYEYRVVNNEDQFYVNIFSGDQGHKDTIVPVYNPFQFNGSRLAIRAVRNPLKLWDGGADYGSLYDMVSQQTFLSGAISTYDKFKTKYGYFEARIKIPSHVGTFPAFWLFHQKRKYEGTQRTEIDIMENLGHAPWYIYNSFHYFTNVTATDNGKANFIRPYPNGQIYTGVDYSQDYHKYAVKWEPGYIAWYIDDNLVSEVWDSNSDYEELYLILNLAMGGNWTNFPTNSGGLGRSSGERFPTANDLAEGNFNDPALEIDYVRVYQKK